VQAGDVIVGVDKTEVPHSEDLPRIVARHTPGTRVDLKVLRGGHEQALSVTLDAIRDEKGKRDGNDTDDSPTASPTSHKLGIQIGEAPGGGVLVQHVAGDSPADGELMPGDVILEVNHTPVAHAGDLSARVAATPKGEPVLLRVRRGDRIRFVAIQLD
jgi:serine protease Do